MPLSEPLLPHQNFRRKDDIHKVKLWTGDPSLLSIPESSLQTCEHGSTWKGVRKQTLEQKSINSEKILVSPLQAKLSVMVGVPCHLCYKVIKRGVLLKHVICLLQKWTGLKECHSLQFDLKVLILCYSLTCKSSVSQRSPASYWHFICFVLTLPMRFLREINFKCVSPFLLLVHNFLTCPPSSMNFEIDTVISKMFCS